MANIIMADPMGTNVSVESKSISVNGIYTAPDGKAYSPVTVAVENSYTAGDEGKVVSSGALVSQTAHATVIANGTIDTTLNNSVVVDVPTGGCQTLTKIASGTYTLVDDATTVLEIPVSYSGDVKYVFCEVSAPIADTAQAVSWQCAFDCPSGSYTQRDYLGIVQSRLANNTLVVTPQYIQPILTESSIRLGRQSSNYPIRANDYKWEIWGYAS